MHLVDFGKLCLSKIFEIGPILDESHRTFRAQSINLCVLEIIPWNNKTWNLSDTIYVEKLLLRERQDKVIRNKLFEIIIQDEVRSDLILTKNLVNTDTNFDYVEQIISKGIALRSKNGLNEFYEHLIATNVLSIYP